MIIIKSKRKCKCGICLKPIELKYRVRENRVYHLSCYRTWTLNKFNFYKEELKELNKQKYKKYMVLEKL